MSSLALIDTEEFSAKLAASGNSISLYKDAIKQAMVRLETEFRQTHQVASLVTHHAQFIDQLLIHAWQQCLRENSEKLVLVAVGGYGRGELHPHSDIDVMILGEVDAVDETKDSIEAFLLFLWDIGLEVGHSVRSLEECVEQASADITIATNLMESRRLYGPDPLFQRMRTLTDREHIWPSRQFFEAKWQEQSRRHHKFNDTAYNLEPNVKEGPGGLRDIQMIGWVAKRHFGVDTLTDLVSRGFLTDDEYQRLDEGQNFLWKVRYGLHVLTGRREDRLLFDHQRNLAQLFGYRDNGKSLAVEIFMKDYYRTVMRLSRLNEMLLQLFQEEILYTNEPGEPKPLNSRFQVRKGFIEVTDEGVFKRYPFALLEIFLLLAQNPSIKGVRAGTIRLLRAHTDLIDDAFRNDIRNRSLFMELLRQPLGITHELRRMNRYGILAAYLPVFGHIVGQMQHDLFHVYTVDEHTMTVLRNLRRFTIAEYHHEFPLCSKVMSSLPKPELIYVAALYHDIAKGRGGDHSQLGAVDAEEFCHQHQLSAYETRLITWLVRNHLLMSTTASRRDISDPEVINEFAQQIGSTEYMDYLYLLTVADIRATSPAVWNSWKDALLAELYHATRNALRRGLSNPIAQEEIILQRKADAQKILKLHRIPRAAIETLWTRLEDDYFMRYSADEIAWHGRAIINQKIDGTIILIRQQTIRGGTEIFLYTPIKEHQFTTTTTALDQIGLSVVDARIIPSKDNFTLDTYIVLEDDGRPISGQYRLAEIDHALRRLLSHPEAEHLTVSRRMPRQLKHFTIPTQVIFREDRANQRTIMEVVCSDRPGLLSHIARALANCHVSLQNAKIATFGERAEDIFFITDANNEPISEKTGECLKLAISEQLNPSQG